MSRDHARRAHDRGRRLRRMPSMIPLKRVYVVEQVVDRRLILQGPCHRAHLRAVEILTMSAANALPEILELSFQVPVAHAREPGRVRRPDALTLVAVTGRARCVQLRSALRVAADAGVGPCIRQRADVRDDVADRGIVGEHRRERDHLFAILVVLVRAAYAVLEAVQLPRQIPTALAGELRRAELLVALSILAVTGSARREQRLARRRITGDLP